MEPFYGGSHKAFADGLIDTIDFDCTLLTLPAIKWKWRMRHSAITFAEKVNNLIANGKSWDLIFCSDMLNLAEFYGLVDEQVKNIPSIIYFHENQFSYPVQNETERDYHFGMINFSSCLASNKVWFNSNFHRKSFLNSLKLFLNRMPDNKNLTLIDKIEQKSEIIYPGISKIEPNFHKKNKHLHILWVARWEHDKNPDIFFDALKIIKEKKYKFNISVIGEQYKKSPIVFNQAKEYFSDEIINWGYQDSVEKYTKILQSADLIISTANHEFYGISVIEAITAGAYPLLPDRLAYPEILQCDRFTENKRCFYDGTVNDLVNKIETILKSHQLNPLRNKNDILNMTIKQYFWDNQHHKIINLLTKSQE